jgi:hypothetical protein
MPSGAKGKNVYQGSTAAQQLQSTSMAERSSAGHAAPSDTLVGNMEGTEGSVDIEGFNAATGDLDEDGDVNPAPPTSPPASPFTSASKRRFSALDGNVSASSVAATPTSRSLISSSSGSAKRGRITGAIALTTIGHGLAGLNTLYRTGLEQEDARHRQRMAWRQESRDHQVHSSNIVDRAMDRVQELESSLSPDQLAGLLEIFEAHPGSARAYLAIKGDGVRNAWIQRKLVSIGLAGSSADGASVGGASVDNDSNM